MKKVVFLLAMMPLIVASCGGSNESNENKEIVIDTTINETIIITNEDAKSVTFASADGLEITGNLYEIDKESPIIVLCHQAGYNKFEYEGTAQRLNELGFNCLAIDQRSGGPIGIYQNETANRAIEKNIAIDYLSARPDIAAAVEYAYNEFDQQVILWGSSYSSTLALWEGLRNDKVKAVVAFSPGDYFPEIGSLTDSLANFQKPFFITCSDQEIDVTAKMLSKTNLTDEHVFYKPIGIGYHGSRALWPGQYNGEQYWTAIKSYLEHLK
ncbi:MAG: hypothetical protein R2780_13720 [Crocinitomicaceae bacterium]|nr:hypothetical protein [Crocinitomicaceae bacterium]